MSENLCCFKDTLDNIYEEDRKIVHEKGLWHKTAHVWLYDQDGYVYFQVRDDSGCLYTSASGHVLAGETPTKTAVRETQEELGIHIDENKLELINIEEWVWDDLDYHDRAFSHIYLYKIPSDFSDFSVDEREVLCVRKCHARILLSSLLSTCDEDFYPIQYDPGMNRPCEVKCKLLTMPGEYSILKYGKILQKVIDRTSAGCAFRYK